MNVQEQEPTLPEASTANVVRRLSRHARNQMTRRRLSEADVTMVIKYGRRVHGRGALIYVIGRKEIIRYRSKGIDLQELEGIHVVCSPDGRILTTYRNRKLKGIRGLR